MNGPVDDAGPSPRCQLFAYCARLALWGAAAIDTLSEEDRRLVAQVWERLDDMFAELDDDDRRWLGISATAPPGSKWFDVWQG